MQGECSVDDILVIEIGMLTVLSTILPNVDRMEFDDQQHILLYECVHFGTLICNAAERYGQVLLSGLDRAYHRSACEKVGKIQLDLPRLLNHVLTVPHSVHTCVIKLKNKLPI